jgi:nicotinamidase-related amidase
MVESQDRRGRSALLIIDVQRAILGEKTQAASGYEVQPAHRALDAMVDRLVQLRRRAHLRSIPVIHVQHAGPAGHRLQKGTAGWQIREELHPAEGETVIEKTECDSFHDTELLPFLVAGGIEHLIVGGCMTPYCIDTTVRRAVGLGFDVTLLQDGHTTCDQGGLRFDQIVDHHNHVLDGFSAGRCQVRLAAAADIL